MYEIKTEILDSILLAQRPFQAERDYIECRIMNEMFQTPYFCDNFIFTGGGTFSKAYRIGNRINRDIDFACLDFKELSENSSINQIGKFNGKFKKYVFTDLKDRIEAIIKDFGKFNIITDRQWRAEHVTTQKNSAPTLHVEYQSMLDPNTKNCVNLEFIPRHYAAHKIEYHTVAPYMIEDNSFTTQIPTITYSQTFWDKVYALYVINQQGICREGLSRHFYDVAHVEPFVKLAETQSMFMDTAKYQQIYTTRNLQKPESVSEINIVPKQADAELLGKDYDESLSQYQQPIVQWPFVMVAIENLNQKLKGM